MITDDLKLLRRGNLKRLMGERFGGSQVDFAVAVKRSPTQINHWLSGHRNPNGDTCRAVEVQLRLPMCWLDQDHGAELANSPPSMQEARPVYQAEGMGKTLAELSGYLKAVDEGTRRMAMGLIAELAHDPGKHATITQMIELSIHSHKKKAA
jgi:hypothetical protein